MQKVVSIFTNSAGALLLALASALFLINWTSPVDVVLPHDPIFQMPLSELFWIIGGITAVAGLICFFNERATISALMVLWLGFCFLVIRVGLWVAGCHGLAGYLGGFTYNFGVTANTTGVMADFVFIYLFIGGCIMLWLGRRLPAPVEFQKMSCPACGGHVKFPLRNLGQKIDCPHCRATVALRNPEERLKSSCFFCQGHIEFPAHSIGTKMPCPHCKKDITLKEPT
ncbi:MAG TPA: hypothetical protein VK742_11370 [Candidatus Sulfotelmatobacter sp.]|jgi:hypothetical protein|nr:hypothetical protein [Candidatus Sulfotelmatobacter sp.]